MNSNNLGLILRARRKEKGLTLTQLASLSEVSAAHIARAERGERLPSGPILRKLAKPLGFSEFELCKLAGFIPRDAVDDRLDKFKKDVKKEVIETLVNLCERLDSL